MISDLSDPPPIFATLLTGLLIAFAVQLLLTSFGIAAGVTAIGYLPEPKSDEATSDPSKSRGGVVRFAIGAGTLLTVNGVLFVACFLAVKLSLSGGIIIGAILGVVIWAAYFLIWVWVSSQAVGSLLGAIFGTLASGLQGLMATVMEAVSGRKSQSITDALRQQIATQESALKALQQEISATDDSTQTTTLQTLQKYLQTLPSPQLDLQMIRNEVADVIRQSDLETVAAGMPVEFDRQSLSTLITNLSRVTRGDHPDLSKRDVHQLLDQLESVWREQSSQASPQSQLLDLLRSANPEVLTEQLTAWLSKQTGADQSASIDFQALDLKQLAKTVLRRVDLSDWDVSKILGQLQSLVGESSAPVNLIQADVEDYLLNAYPWQLTRKTVQQEFKDVIYDPEGDPAEILNRLAPLNPEYLTKVLQKRDDLKPAQLSKVVDRLESVRQEVLTEVQVNEDESNQKIYIEANTLWNQFETYTSDISEKLTAKNIQRQVKQFIKECQSDLADLKQVLPAFDRTAIEQRLIDRQDLSEKRIQQVIQQLEKAWNHFIESDSKPIYAATTIHRSTVPIHSLGKTPKRFALRAKTSDQDFQETLSDYLCNTDKAELTAENIQYDLQRLLQDSKSGLQHLSDRLSHLDRTTLISLLSQRQDLTETEATQIVEQIESNLQHFTEQLQQIQQQMQTTIAHTVLQLRDRLTSLELPDLDYDRIKQDVQALLADPQAGIASISRRLSAVNRDSILEFLKSRDDLSELVTHQIVDRIDAVHLSLSQQAEHLQHEAQQRLEALKKQAQRQAEDTRRAVATAAWWLFGVAFTSAITSAIAGGLAVTLR
jgi:ElaB/YqjD/DUF883 family membrane-anchored ribosome-binding protein